MLACTRSHSFVIVVLLLPLAAGALARAGEPSFRGLGDLPGGASSSRAFGVSADGTVVVGEATSASGREAFRWTAGGGMVGLGDLPGGAYESVARAVSADGSVIVGRGRRRNDRVVGDYEAFRWTAAGGMVGVGTSATTGFFSSAFDVSADGSVLVGEGNGFAGAPFRWTAADGPMQLGDPGGQAGGVSADGSVVVGWHHDGTNATSAFRWTQQGGFVHLGDLPGSFYWSTGGSISDDGSTVAGQSLSAKGPQAFRWRAETGMVGLGFLSGDTESSASGVSADGSVVVGQSGLVRPRPFVWDSINGMQSLESILASHGVNTTGWKLQDITDVTPDGVTVVGMGLNPSGQEEAFIATIPEPAALSLLCLAVPLAAWRRRPRAAAGRGL